MRKKTRLNDNASILAVALEAGVSTATVSRVLNRSAVVAPETVKLVMKSVASLGYELPQRKRRTRTSKTGRPPRPQIAILGIGNAGSGWLEVPVIARAVLATTRAATEQGYGVMLEDIPGPEMLSAAIREGQVAGAVIWLSGNLGASVFDEVGRYVPIVRAMGDQLGPVRVDHVAPNNRQVGALASQFLRQRGCEEVLFVSTHPHWDLMRIRADGFFESAEGHHAPGSSVLVASEARATFARRPAVCCPDWDSAADLILSGRKRPLGIFTARDYEASQIYPLMAARGARFGEDVIVVSCDNDSTWLSGLSPRPASIDLLSEEVGRRAFGQLIARIERPGDPPVQILITPRLNLAHEQPAGEPSVTVRKTLPAPMAST